MGRSGERGGGIPWSLGEVSVGGSGRRLEIGKKFGGKFWGLLGGRGPPYPGVREKFGRKFCVAKAIDLVV